MAITFLRRRSAAIWLPCSAVAFGAAIVIMGTGAVGPLAQSSAESVETGYVVRYDASRKAGGPNDNLGIPSATTPYEGVCTGPAGGSRWDVPMPDQDRLVTSASIWFDAYKRTWTGHYANMSGKTYSYDASVDWGWSLTGHPMLFPQAPDFFGGSGHFAGHVVQPPGQKFYTEWVIPAAGATFTGSSLTQLLGMEKNGELILWYETAVCNATLNGKDAVAWSMGGEPLILWYQYTYGRRRGDPIPPGPGKLPGKTQH